MYCNNYYSNNNIILDQGRNKKGEKNGTPSLLMHKPTTANPALRPAIRIRATRAFRLNFNASIPYYSLFSLAVAAHSRQPPNRARPPLIGSSRSALWLIMTKRARVFSGIARVVRVQIALIDITIRFIRGPRCVSFAIHAECRALPPGPFPAETKKWSSILRKLPSLFCCFFPIVILIRLNIP